MIRLDAKRAVSFCDGLTRRDFLHAGAISSLGLTLPGFFAGLRASPPGADATGSPKPDNDVNCIMLFLVDRKSTRLNSSHRL